jgi:hypothetical protein
VNEGVDAKSGTGATDRDRPIQVKSNLTHPCSLVFTTRNEIRSIRTQLNIRDLLVMTILHRNDFLTRLDVVFRNFTTLVAGDEVFGKGCEECDGGF